MQTFASLSTFLLVILTLQQTLCSASHPLLSKKNKKDLQKIRTDTTAEFARDSERVAKPTTREKGKSQTKGKGKEKEEEEEGSRTRVEDMIFYAHPTIPIERRLNWNTDWKPVTDKSIPGHEKMQYVRPKDPKHGVVVIRERLPWH